MTDQGQCDPGIQSNGLCKIRAQNNKKDPEVYGETLYRRIFYATGAEGGLDPDTALGQTFIGVNL